MEKRERKTIMNKNGEENRRTKVSKKEGSCLGLVVGGVIMCGV